MAAPVAKRPKAAPESLAREKMGVGGAVFVAPETIGLAASSSEDPNPGMNAAMDQTCEFELPVVEPITVVSSPDASVEVESVKSSDISGVSNFHGEIREPYVGYRREVEAPSAAAEVEPDITVVSSEPDIASLHSPLAANLFPPLTPRSTQCHHAFGNDGVTAGDTGFGMGAFLDPEPGPGGGSDNLLLEPPGLNLGDPFCPTFSIDAPPTCHTPTKPAVVKGNRASMFDNPEPAELSFDSSVCGPAPRVLGPGDPGPYREPRTGPTL